MVTRRTVIGSLASVGLLSFCNQSNGEDANGWVPRCKTWTQNQIALDSDFVLYAALYQEVGYSWAYKAIRFGSLGFLYSIADEAHRPIETPKSPQPHPFVPRLPLSSESFARLETGMLFGSAVKQTAHEIFPAPGVYRISVSYLSPVMKSEFANSDPFLSDHVLLRDQGTILAPELTIRVV